LFFGWLFWSWLQLSFGIDASNKLEVVSLLHWFLAKQRSELSVLSKHFSSPNP
jgi:hypothetical protein